MHCNRATIGSCARPDKKQIATYPMPNRGNGLHAIRPHTVDLPVRLIARQVKKSTALGNWATHPQKYACYLGRRLRP
jgi:hypothetical protein